MSEYDFRQYRLMLDLVKESILSMDSLGKILNDLQALTSVLEEKDEEWLSRFKTQWWIMEEIYAYYHSDGLQNLSEDALTKIDKSRRELYLLVQSKVQAESRN